MRSRSGDCSTPRPAPDSSATSLSVPASEPSSRSAGRRARVRRRSASGQRRLRENVKAVGDHREARELVARWLSLADHTRKPWFVGAGLCSGRRRRRLRRLPARRGEAGRRRGAVGRGSRLRAAQARHQRLRLAFGEVRRCAPIRRGPRVQLDPVDAEWDAFLGRLRRRRRRPRRVRPTAVGFLSLPRQFDPPLIEQREHLKRIRCAAPVLPRALKCGISTQWWPITLQGRPCMNWPTVLRTGNVTLATRPARSRLRRSTPT